MYNNQGSPSLTDELCNKNNEYLSNHENIDKGINNSSLLFQNKKTKRDQKENISKESLVYLNKRPKIEIFNNNPNIYSYVTKNGKMKILYKFEIPFDQVKQDKTFCFENTYKTIRNDIWTFIVKHTFFNKVQGGKVEIDLKVNREYQIVHDEIISSLSKITSSLYFSIDMVVNMVNFKVHNFTISALPYNALNQSIEIILPFEYYTHPQHKNLNGFVGMVELTISKNYSSISKLPYNGIYNEGATCYVNSMLQTLNSISSFKRAVFQIPTEKDDYSSVALSLQRLFYDLMVNRSPVSAKTLLNSFGWSREQIQIQHDVQEFNLLLSEVMQNKMKGTPCDGAFNNLFEGKLMNYIRCVNVDYHSERIEKFVDLQLTIKNYKNIYQSLDAYTEEEILDNEDKYETEGYGKQKAKKGIRFIYFPPILTMQLKRFEYNSKKEIMVKINDYFEYYDEIDLSRYVDQNEELNENNTDNIYTLHSVVVHQGNANSGHYFSFIKPTAWKRDWLQFNDETVRPADEYEIYNENFGGVYEIFKMKGKGEIVSNNVNYERTAYILVYIKKSLENELLEPVNMNSIPIYLRKRFEMEKEEEENNIKKKKRNNENINLLIFSNQNCCHHINKLGIVNSFFDVNVDSPFIYNHNYRMLLSFPKNLTFVNLLSFISEKTNIPINCLILYEYQNCSNLHILSRQDYDMKLITSLSMSLIEYKTNFKKTFLSFFIYVKGDYTLFTNITSSKEFTEEETYSNSNGYLIYIPKNYNKYCFKFNPDDSSNKHDTLLNFQTYIDENISRKIIFIKKYDGVLKTLSLEKIIDFSLDKLTTSQEVYNLIVSKLSAVPIKIIIEQSSPIELLEEELMVLSQCENHLTNENALSTLSSVSSLILIPVYPNQTFEEVSSWVNSLFLTLYVDFYTMNSVRLIKKMKVELKPNLDESHLRELILKQLKEKHLLPLIVNSKDHYYIDHKKNMMLLTEEFLKEYLKPDHLEIFDDSEMNQRQNSGAREFKILTLLNIYECRFYFKLSLYKPNEISDFYYQDIYLYDINNNEICLISAIIPKKIKKCGEVLDYLYEILKTKFASGYMKKNYYFILQSNSRNFAYQLITDNNIDFKLYENKAKDIEYRLQPFLDTEIKKFYNSNYRKVFINFSELHFCKFMPIIAYFLRRDKFSEIKLQIESMLTKNKKYDLFIQEKGFLDFQMYKAYIMNGKIIKDSNNLIKLDDILDTQFKEFSGAINLYIEFI